MSMHIYKQKIREPITAIRTVTCHSPIRLLLRIGIHSITGVKPCSSQLMHSRKQNYVHIKNCRVPLQQANVSAINQIGRQLSIIYRIWPLE